MQGEIKKEKEYLTQEGHLCKFEEKERRYIRVYTHNTHTSHDATCRGRKSEQRLLYPTALLSISTPRLRDIQTHTQKQRDRERESSFLVTSTSTHAYALLLLNFRERERERERRIHYLMPYRCRTY